MPGPNIRNRVAEEKRASANQREVYFLTDPNCQTIHGLDVTDEMRENGIKLTGQEAMALVAAGAVTKDKAEAQRAADEMKAGIDALTKRREDEAEAKRLREEEDAEAAAHNSGQSTAAPAADPQPQPGTLSSAEVDRHMASTDPSPEPSEKTWGQSGA